MRKPLPEKTRTDIFKYTRDMVTDMMCELQAIDPCERDLKRLTTRRKLSIMEVLNAFIWRGAREEAKDRGIEFRWEEERFRK